MQCIVFTSVCVRGEGVAVGALFFAVPIACDQNSLIRVAGEAAKQ